MKKISLVSLTIGVLISARICTGADFCSNQIGGTLSFNNINPDILNLLDAPGNEGMSNVFVYANSVPAGRSATSAIQPTSSRLSGDYAITVDADCTNENGIAYQISPVAILGNGQQYYYFDPQTSAPVTAEISGPALNFQECVGVLLLKFRTSAGAPVGVDNGVAYAYRLTDSSYASVIYSMAAGTTEHRLYVQGGREHRVDLRLFRGTDPYTDRQVHYVTTNLTVECEGIQEVDIVMPSFETFGQITGTVDMRREFEWSVDGNDQLVYPDFTSVVANNGPFLNERWYAVGGDNVIVPSSGTFNLINVIPSTVDSTVTGYNVYGQMMFRPGRSVQYFRTPGLGSGSNAPVVIEPGQTVDLDNILEIDPGYMRGQILLQGPPEIPERRSLLRGLLHAGDNDVNGDGIPDVAGTYGIYHSSLGYEGLDRRATAASYTAAGGFGYGDFEGSYMEAGNSYLGQYELALGGLHGEAAIWRPSFLSLTLSSGDITNDNDYYYNVYSIQSRGNQGFELAPEQAITNDLAYCFSEVIVVFNSPSASFYGPQVVCGGSFSGIDFRGMPADYFVSHGQTFGTPSYQHQATNRGQVVMLLPQGDYRLDPAVVPNESSGGLVGLAPIQLTVGCGQRIILEPCLQMNLVIPECYRSNEVILGGSVQTLCSNSVVEITYELNGAPPVTVCNDCGENPTFNFTVALAEGDNALTVKAYDNRGGVTSIGGAIRSDNVPPLIQCPANIQAEATRPCGANVQFFLSATDNCADNPSIACSPQSGSLFPPGETTVTCTASDAAGNSSQCAFTVTVSGGPEFLAPAVTSVSPQVIGTAGGSQMTIRGANFTIDDVVLLDGVPLLYPVLVSAQEIQGQAPALPGGGHQLQIERCGTIVATVGNACQSGGLPRMFTLTPRQAYVTGGNTITILGTNFLPTTQVRIAFAAPGGTENLLVNSVVSEDGTIITGQVPPLPDGELLGPRDVIAEDVRGRDILPAGICYLPNVANFDLQVAALRELEADSQTPVEIRMRNGFPNAITARVSIQAANSASRALGFVAEYRDLFRLSDPAQELTAAPEAAGILENVRLTQSYRGLPILGAELSVMMAGNEVLDAIGGLLPTEAIAAAALNIEPSLSAEDAVAIARAALGRQDAAVVEAPILAIFDRCLLQDAPSNPHLIWTVTIEGSDVEYYVDAHSGAIVFRNALERSHGGDLEGLDLDMRDAQNMFSPTNAPACYGSTQVLAAGDENGLGAGYGNDANMVAARTHMINTYRFFHQNFGWHSYNNQSSQLRVFVHSTVANAQWSSGCKVISFRDGFVDFEVMVHELTHGIVGASSQLRYFLESGALDESYSDVMAVLADRQAGSTNWTVGEDRIGSMGAIRDIPNNRIRFWAQYNPGDGTETAANDFGNVHSNSGIPNYAAYLKATKTRFINGHAFYPLSETKLARLKFDALRSLTKDSTFMAARTREITLATEWAKNNQYGFTDDDITIVRLGWADVGIGNELDTDRDGMPDIVDNCPFRPNPRQEDADLDRVGDICDNCREFMNRDQADMDHDGVGDVCDLDRDGDGCLNTVDQHPNSSVARVGTFISASCQEKSGIEYASEALHHDGDGTPDCADFDDDGDGVLDDADSCPTVFGTNPEACKTVRDCPLIANDWWRTCLGGGCVQYYSRFINAINPDPMQAVIIEDIRIVNQTLYLQPSAGTSVANLAGRISQFNRQLVAANGSGGEPERLRVEIWSRPTETEPAHLVAVVGEYDPENVELQQLVSGSMLAFNPSSSGATLGATWLIGADPSTAGADADNDGIPDGWELQHGLSPGNGNDGTIDSDADGISNFDEYQAGTDPQDPLSLFKILNFSRVGNEVTVTFIGTPARRFKLLRALDLATSSWDMVAELSARGGIATLRDSGSPDEQAFYRLESVSE